MVLPRKFSRIFLIAGVFAALFSFSCKDPGNVVFREIREFGFNPSTGFNFKVVLYNPNTFSFRISDTRAEVLMNGRSFGVASQTGPVNLPANGEATIQCTLKINANDALRLLPSGLETLLGGKPMTVKTVGSSDVSKLLFSKTIRFESEQQVDGKLLRSFF